MSSLSLKMMVEASMLRRSRIKHLREGWLLKRPSRRCQILMHMISSSSPDSQPQIRSLISAGVGVGLDVVKTAINGLQGTIKIDSTPGEGTRFELVLPPTMAIVMVMMIRINGRRCAIPITNVAEVASLAAFPSRILDMVKES